MRIESHELRNRDLADALIVSCDTLRDLRESIRATWPDAAVQTCVVHMVPNSLRYASRKHWGQITKTMRAIYTAPPSPQERPNSRPCATSGPPPTRP